MPKKPKRTGKTEQNSTKGATSALLRKLEREVAATQAEEAKLESRFSRAQGAADAAWNLWNAKVNEVDRLFARLRLEQQRLEQRAIEKKPF